MQPDLSLLQPPFILGAGSSAYQIEGAVCEDGRGPTIWDRFVRLPGVIRDGSNGDRACDHYHCVNEDAALLKWMGLDGYRFSIGWSRIVPDGAGAINQRGLDFYDRLVDTLLENGVQPYPTLYHLDLPEGLQSKGGWLNRDTAKAFEAYAVAVAARLKDRVPMWLTHHEPWCQAFLGYEYGVYAPGMRDFAKALRCAHHLLLSHGLAVRALRGVTNSPIGVALNFTPAYPGSSREVDLLAAQRHNGYVSGWFLDPIAGWGYPEHLVRHYGDLMPVFPSTDMDVIAAPIDVLGVTYYQRVLVVHEENDGGILQLAHLERPGPSTANREIYPKALGDVLRDLHFHYGFQNLIVADNGAAFEERPDVTGFVSDENRVDFIRQHLHEVALARADGIPVNGYFVRSLLDGFEFSDGYTIRYGLCHTDTETMVRTPKASAHFLRSLRKA